MTGFGASDRQQTGEGRFVCVHNRDRDHYEVALALHEAGLLEALVTEFYRPDALPQALAGPLGRRWRAGLPSRLVHASWPAFVRQYAAQTLRRPMEPVFAACDRMLANKAARLAARRGAGLYAYASYLDPASALPQGCPVIDFEYHPHAQLSLEILADDLVRYPEAVWSFARERELALDGPQIEAWRCADAVVCASAMTRRTLVHAGCPEQRIEVIPYGAPEFTSQPQPRGQSGIRFLFVGQGVQRKGLHHLAHAWRVAALADAELVVVSYLADPGIAALLDQPGITVLGRLPRAALDAEFAGADVFVMPSLVEGFGLVYLEALAAGCHVVGTTNTGLPDLDLPAQAATVLPPGDIAALASALCDLAEAKGAGRLDPVAIQRHGSARSWADFRAGIGRHAAAVLGAQRG